MAGVALAAGTIVGVAGASPSDVGVTFVPLAAPHKVLSGTTIAAHKTSSPVVIGSSTTVPTNATTVQLSVSAKGAVAGSLSFYPAGNPSGASGQTLAYPSGNVLASTVIEENVGVANEVTVLNNGAGSAVVTMAILGYSTQVTAGDINGTGGSAGQVLTNTGSGASWQSVGTGYAAGSGFNDLGSSPTVASLTLPAGDYDVTFTTQIFNATGAQQYVNCYLYGPNGGFVSDAFGDAPPDAPGLSATTQAIIAIGASGGTVYVQCGASHDPVYAYYSTLIATLLGNANGAISAVRRAVPQNLNK